MEPSFTSPQHANVGCGLLNTDKMQKTHLLSLRKNLCRAGLNATFRPQLHNVSRWCAGVAGGGDDGNFSLLSSYLCRSP